jgi:hypothetical protein
MCFFFFKAPRARDLTVETRLAHSCYLYAIRLAARIWGAVIRHYLSATSKPGASARGTVNRDALLRASNLRLPPHLHYLLHL